MINLNGHLANCDTWSSTLSLPSFFAFSNSSLASILKVIKLAFSKQVIAQCPHIQRIRLGSQKPSLFQVEGDWAVWDNDNYFRNTSHVFPMMIVVWWIKEQPSTIVGQLRNSQVCAASAIDGQTTRKIQKSHKWWWHNNTACNLISETLIKNSLVSRNWGLTTML